MEEGTQPKKRKYGIWIPIILLGLVLVIFLLFWNYKKDNEEIEDTYGMSQELYDYWYNIIFLPTTQYDSIWGEQTELDILDSIMPFQERSEFCYELMLGLVNCYMENTEESHTHIQRAQDMLDPDDLDDPFDVITYARCLYEQAHYNFGCGDVEEGKSYIQNMQDFLIRYEDYENLVYYTIWVFTESYEMENGAPYSEQLADQVADYLVLYGYYDLGYAYQCLADMYSYSGNYAKFIRYMSKALDFYENDEDKVFCLINIGIAYISEDNLDVAIEYLERALEIDVISDPEYNAQMKFYASINVAVCYLLKEDVQNAKEWLDISYDWLQKEQNVEAKTEDYANYLMSLSEYHVLTQEYEQALKELDESKEIYSTSKNFSYTNFLVLIYSDYGNLYLEMGDYESAISYYEKCKELVEHSQTDMEASYIFGMYECYVGLKDTDQIVYYANRVQEFLEGKLSLNQTLETEILSYEGSKKDAEIVDLNSSRQRYFIFLVVITGAFILSLTLSIKIKIRNRQIKKLSDEFEQLSIRDGLTNLYNRRMLDRFLTEEWEKLTDGDQILSMAMIDIDHFKLYNDHYGHQKGDEVIQHVADIFALCSDEIDFVARYGGEEFIWVMPDTSSEDAYEKMNRIMLALKENSIAHEFSFVEKYVTLSIGVVTLNNKEQKYDYERVIQYADDALYEAKKCRNVIVQKEL